MCDLFRPNFGTKKTPEIISVHDVWKPWKQALLASRDVIISSQFAARIRRGFFTLGDGCWLPSLPREGGGAKGFGMYLENKLFFAGYLVKLPGYPGCVRKAWKQKGQGQIFAVWILTRNSQFWSEFCRGFLGVFFFFFVLFFPRKEAPKNHQKIPRKIHPGICLEKFPSDFCRSLLLIILGGRRPA